MAETLILLSASPGEQRTVLVEDGLLRELWIERPSCSQGLGDLHVGRVSARAPALSGVFVTLVGGESGFLPDAQGGEGLSEGRAVTVTVTRVAQGGKGPRLAARMPRDLLDSGPPRLIARGPRAAVRLARAHPSALVRTDSSTLLGELHEELGPDRVSLRKGPAFDDSIEAEIEIAASPEVALPGGGRLLICPTPALTSIDVDGGSVAGRDRDAHRRLNVGALVEVARQIRLRQLAGPIFLDLAGMSARSRASFVPGLRSALDSLTRVIGMTGLGFIEMVRTRVGPPLHEVLGTPPTLLTHGLTALRAAARHAQLGPPSRLKLRASPRVVATLSEQKTALEEYARMAVYPLTLVVDASVPPGREIIEE